MRTIQKMRYETAMAIFHADPIAVYEKAIERHKKAIWRLRVLIKELRSKKP